MPSVSLDAIRPLYGFVDPHGGGSDARLKRIASQASICVGGADHLGRIFVVSAWAGRVSTGDLMDRMCETVERWNIRVMGGEANALQGLFQDAVVRDAKWRGKRMPLLKVYQPTTVQKNYRIRTVLQPLVGHGKLFLPAGAAELIAQITSFPLSPHQDMIDCVASLCRLIPARTPRSEIDSERAARVKYLRDTGAPLAAIEAVMRA